MSTLRLPLSIRIGYASYLRCVQQNKSSDFEKTMKRISRQQVDEKRASRMMSFISSKSTRFLCQPREEMHRRKEKEVFPKAASVAR